MQVPTISRANPAHTIPVPGSFLRIIPVNCCSRWNVNEWSPAEVATPMSITVEVSGAVFSPRRSSALTWPGAIPLPACPEAGLITYITV